MGASLFLVFVTGVIDIIRFFDNNLDFFTAVLNLYAPVALSMVTTGDSRPRVSCTVAPSPTVTRQHSLLRWLLAQSTRPSANLPTAPTTTNGAYSKVEKNGCCRHMRFGCRSSQYYFLYSLRSGFCTRRTTQPSKNVQPFRQRQNRPNQSSHRGTTASP